MNFCCLYNELPTSSNLKATVPEVIFFFTFYNLWRRLSLVNGPFLSPHDTLASDVFTALSPPCLLEKDFWHSLAADFSLPFFF